MGISYFHNKIQIKDLQTDIFLIKSLITRQAIFNLTSTVEVLVVVPSSFFTISTENKFHHSIHFIEFLQTKQILSRFSESFTRVDNANFITEYNSVKRNLYWFSALSQLYSEGGYVVQTLVHIEVL